VELCELCFAGGRGSFWQWSGCGYMTEVYVEDYLPDFGLGMCAPTGTITEMMKTLNLLE
jgi:hypothetical protein